MPNSVQMHNPDSTNRTFGSLAPSRGHIFQQKGKTCSRGPLNSRTASSAATCNPIVAEEPTIFECRNATDAPALSARPVFFSVVRFLVHGSARAAATSHVRCHSQHGAKCKSHGSNTRVPPLEPEPLRLVYGF